MKIVVFCLIVLFIVVGCTSQTGNVSNVAPSSTSSTNNFSPVVVEAPEVEFTGEKGQAVEFVDDQIVLDKALFDGGLVQYFNVDVDGSPIYFFVVKDKDGVYRAAANACQVCSDSKMGFYQDGNFMVCNTCGNRYPLEKIATEKGGCNPVPINPNLISKNGNIILEKQELKGLERYF